MIKMVGWFILWQNKGGIDVVIEFWKLIIKTEVQKLMRSCIDFNYLSGDKTTEGQQKELLLLEINFSALELLKIQ